MYCGVVGIHGSSRWLFQCCFFDFDPLVGEMMEFDYVSNGLKPYPTSSWICLVGDVLRIVPWDSSRFFTIWDTLPETNIAPEKLPSQ